MTGMCQSEDPLTRYLATQPEIQHQTYKWTRPAAIDGHPIDTKEQQCAALLARMVKTADCYGLANAQHVPYANHWVKDGFLLIPYTLGKDVPGTNLDPYCDHCGYPIEEYLSHIIQVCDRTHGPRIHRHNLLVHKLVKMLRAKGWQTLCEPSNTWVKPDIIVWKEDQSVVIDAIVHSDASMYSPNKFHFDKVAKYEAIPEVTTYVKNLTGHAPKFSALAINWR